MSTRLYSKEDNEQFNSFIDFAKKVETPKSLIEHSSEAPDNNLNTEDKEIVNEVDNKIFDNIKDIFLNESKTSELGVLFTTGKGKTSINIDSTIFAPTPLTILFGKRFELEYTRQLENLIFTDKELNSDNLMYLIYIMDFIIKGKYPISVKSGKYKYLNGKMVSVLNMFFKKNYTVISSIYTMFAGISNLPSNLDKS